MSLPPALLGVLSFLGATALFKPFGFRLSEIFYHKKQATDDSSLQRGLD